MTSAALSSQIAARRAPAAVVIGDDRVPRSEVRRLLTAAGFAVESAVDRTPFGIDRDGIAVAFAGADASSTQRLAALAERLQGTPIVAVMSAQASGNWLRRVLRAGVAGIVLDDRLEVALAATAWAVAAGQISVPPALRRHLAPRPLSHREKEILGLVVLGYTNRQIADRLFVAESTVKTHLASVFTKLDARSRSEVTALVLDPEEGYGGSVLAMAEMKDQPAASR
jgi:DNA-binding NarL/FixJ family response regulator